MALPREQGETIDHYDRRRKREARNSVASSGSWAQKWAKRAVEWYEHLQRAQNRNDILGLLVFWHGQDWLQQQRAIFVSSGLDSRNSLAAGNTGARVLAQRPQ